MNTMKTKEELNAMKEEVETLNKKLHELTEEELAQVSGGTNYPLCGSPVCNYASKEACTYYKAVGGHVRCRHD